jgi:hypothetical protein
MSTDAKLQRLQALYTSLTAKAKTAYTKYERARSPRMQDRWWEIYRRYSALNMYRRAHDLADMIRYNNGCRPIYGAAWWAESQYKSRLDWKEKKRIEFLTKRRYSVWFMQRSLSADYGTFTCDKCGSTFYHSPSIITKAREELYHCACGHCTNDIINQDWGERPFS